jgi:hypothetical protein
MMKIPGGGRRSDQKASARHMSDELEQEMQNRSDRPFRWRATAGDGDKPLGGGLGDRADVAIAVRVSRPRGRHLEAWDSHDRDYAALKLKQIAAVQPVRSGTRPVAAPRPIEYWNWWQVLSWIKHRCREKLKVTGMDRHDGLHLCLTVAIQQGEIECIDPSGLKVPCGRPFNHEREPNVLFRANDIIEKWPAAFLEPFPKWSALTLSPTVAVICEEVVPPDGDVDRMVIRSAKAHSADRQSTSPETRDSVKKREAAIIKLVMDKKIIPTTRGWPMKKFAREVQLEVFGKDTHRVEDGYSEERFRKIVSQMRKGNPSFAAACPRRSQRAPVRKKVG